MKPLVLFDSSLGPLNAEGLPEGRTIYHGHVPRGARRWRVVIAANCKPLKIRVEHDIRPAAAVSLSALVHSTIMPLINEAIAEARQTINEVLRVPDSEQTHEITTEFQVFKWR